MCPCKFFSNLTNTSGSNPLEGDVHYWLQHGYLWIVMVVFVVLYFVCWRLIHVYTCCPRRCQNPRVVDGVRFAILLVLIVTSWMCFILLSGMSDFEAYVVDMVLARGFFGCVEGLAIVDCAWQGLKALLPTCCQKKLKTFHGWLLLHMKRCPELLATSANERQRRGCSQCVSCCGRAILNQLVNMLESLTDEVKSLQGDLKTLTQRGAQLYGKIQAETSPIDLFTLYTNRSLLEPHNDDGSDFQHNDEDADRNVTCMRYRGREECGEDVAVVNVSLEDLKKASPPSGCDILSIWTGLTSPYIARYIACAAGFRDPRRNAGGDISLIFEYHSRCVSYGV